MTKTWNIWLLAISGQLCVCLLNEIAEVHDLTKNYNKPLTNNQGALDFLQDEAGLVSEFSILSPQHACQPVLS